MFHVLHSGLVADFRRQAAFSAVVRAARSGRHAVSKRPDNALKVRTFRPPSTLQRARFMRWLTSTLLADDAGAVVLGLEARVGGARACGRTSRSRIAVAVFVVALSRRWRIADLVDAARRAG